MPFKEAVLTLARTAGLAAAARKATARHLRVLCYHGLWVTPGYRFSTCTFMQPEHFLEHMKLLKRSGQPVLPLGEAVDRLAEGTLPPAAVAITIDDAWVSTLTHMLPVLEELEMPATLYATTWYSGRELPVINMAVRYLREAAGRPDVDAAAKTAEIEALPIEERLEALKRFGAELGVDDAWLKLRQFNIMSPEELAEAHRRGLDVQLHTHRHIELGDKIDALPEEIAENRAFLRNAVGDVPLTHFCYPSGSYHPRAPSVLAANGVRSATLVTQGLNPPGSDPLKLRRFLDGRNVTNAKFEAYLSGLLHYTDALRGWTQRKRHDA
jgi:peptidoglycan/xylan/chitin deacetylase (PgdA/CDA1 family)